MPGAPRPIPSGGRCFFGGGGQSPSSLVDAVADPFLWPERVWHVQALVFLHGHMVLKASSRCRHRGSAQAGHPSIRGHLPVYVLTRCPPSHLQMAAGLVAVMLLASHMLAVQSGAIGGMAVAAMNSRGNKPRCELCISKPPVSMHGVAAAACDHFFRQKDHWRAVLGWK